MLAEVKGSRASRCTPNESVICNRSWKTEYILRGIPPACVAARAGKKDRRRRWFAMSFRIRLRSLAVSTRPCTSCHTRTTHESLSTSRIFVFRLTITRTRLIHCSNLCSSCIRPGLFTLLSAARFLLTLRLLVAFYFTIGAK